MASDYPKQDLALLGDKRHPEKRNNPDNPRLVKPDWIRVKAPTSPQFLATQAVVRQHRLSTVCEEAGCPNMGSCWEKRHATFMILGSLCTRACGFCNVATGKPGGKLDNDEPKRVAQAVATMGLSHAVITSVDRDDLPDGGSAHFVAVIEAIRNASPLTTIEVLTPDFRGKEQALEPIIKANPDVFNHNLETVPRLYPSIRPGARYFTSLSLLAGAKRLAPQGFTKSGLMVGLGEDDEEIGQVMDDLRAAQVDFLTIGQYLAPSPKHAAVKRFVSPSEFDRLKALALGKGFLMVAASPLTRSSYLAGDDFAKLQSARRAQLGNSFA